MLEEKKVQEECLYCHSQVKIGNPCPACGDTKLAESQRPDTSPLPTPMFSSGPKFEPQIAGV